MVQPPDQEASAHPVLTLFYCYAREDKDLRDKIDVHLAALHRSRLVTSWHDAMIMLGANWEHEIQTHLNAADIILLLVSPDFLNSDYCYGREMLRAIERHTKGEAHVIPILLRPVDWEDTPFSALQMLPTDAIPVTQWADRDAAFADIARGIRRVVTSIIAHKRLQEQERKQKALAEQQRQKALAETLIERGKALMVQMCYKEALAAYDHALAIDPTLAIAWNNKGWALYFLQRYEEALAAYDHALAIDPTLAIAWTGKGDDLISLQRYEEALAAYDHALALDPYHAFTWSNKAFVLRQLGRTSEAIVAEQRARLLHKPFRL